MAYWSRDDSEYKRYLRDLAERESGNNPRAHNSLGFVGLYQMGEAAMIDAGLYKWDGTKTNDWKGSWTGKYGVWSLEGFKNDPAAQTKAIYDFHQKMMGYVDDILANPVESYIGKVVLGVEITYSGILAGAHLLGQGGVRNFLDRGIDGTDAYGTKISSYMKQFSGYDFGGSNPTDNDILHGNNGANTLYGHDGDDQLFGHGGNDKLFGGHGNDKLYGGNGDDYLTGQEDHDRVYGGAGHDKIYGGSGWDYLDGGSGNDYLSGWTGNDTLYGRSGNDFLNGGSNYDKLYGGYGNDKLYGGSGNDFLSGQEDHDRVYGQAGNDKVYGGSGWDYLHGGSGDDKLYGYTGNDTLIGSTGKDYLDGGDGNDKMWGGDGFDIFKFAPGSDKDTIYDFNPTSSGDVIDIRGHRSITSKADLFENHISTNGNNTIIDLKGGDVLTLVGVKESQLGYEDFWI